MTTMRKEATEQQPSITTAEDFFDNLMVVLNKYIKDNKSNVLTNPAKRKDDIVKLVRIIYDYYENEVELDNDLSAVLNKDNLALAEPKLMRSPKVFVAKPDAHTAVTRFDSSIKKIIELLNSGENFKSGVFVPYFEYHVYSTDSSDLKSHVARAIKDWKSVLIHLKEAAKKDSSYLLVFNNEERPNKVNNEHFQVFLESLPECIIQLAAIGNINYFI